LHQNVEASFLREKPAEIFEELDNAHGSVEKRTYSVINDLKWIEKKEEWKGLQSMVKVESEVYNKLSSKTTTDVRFYICSLALMLPKVDIKKIANGIRSHWGIENLLHWCLDVAFDEDSS
jgi:predicted transposase YbfD/YdcC